MRHGTPISPAPSSRNWSPRSNARIEVSAGDEAGRALWMTGMRRTLRVRRRWTLDALCALLAVLALVGCTAAGPNSPRPDATSTLSTPTRAPSPSPLATRMPTPSPTLPEVPIELVGVWETDLRDYYEDEEFCAECGPLVRFEIGANGSWSIARAGGEARGFPLIIEDGVLVFRPSRACRGIGRYEWQTGANTLTLTAVGQDQCETPEHVTAGSSPWRQEALNGPTYTRAD